MALQLVESPTRGARAVAATGVRVAGSAATAQTTFTDRASWEAAGGGGFSIEDFDALAPTGDLPLGVTAVGSFSVEYAETSPSATGSVRLADGADGLNVNGTNFLRIEVDGSPNDEVTLIFNPPVRAWGADVLAPFFGNPIDVDLDGVFLAQPAQTDAPGFFGFRSDVPVARVTFRNGFTSTSQLGLDNVSFGDEAFLVSTLADGPVAAAGDLPGSLRQAVFDVNANPGADVVQFAPGLSGAIVLTNGQLNVTESVTIEGPGALQVIISGNNTTRVFGLGAPGPNAYDISGLTIAHGDSIRDNGSAIRMQDPDDTLRIRGAIIRDNRNFDGAGTAIFMTGGSIALTDTAVVNNSGGRGVLYLQDAGAVVSNSTFSGNSGAFGDIWVRGAFGLASARIEHSTFAGYFGSDTGVITYSAELAGSIAESSYGNCVFAGRSQNFVRFFAPAGPTTVTSLGHNIIDDASSDTFAAGTDLTSTNPMLGPLETTAGTIVHFLMAGSPAIDAGDPNALPGQSGVPFFDQRGGLNYRVLNNRIDIGAVEAPPNANACVADVTTDGTANDVPDGSVTLSDFSYYLSLWSQGCP